MTSEDERSVNIGIILCKVICELKEHSKNLLIV